MATAAPHVKLLREISAARDEHRSGAVDIAWPGVRASLFLVFGQPSHATLEHDDGPLLEGEEALTALLNELPPSFTVHPWRRVMVPSETLKCSIDDVLEPLARHAGVNAGSRDESAVDQSQVEVQFGVDDFPLLPFGSSLWSDAAAHVVHLDVLVPNLPDSLIVLTAARVRAAAVVVEGAIIDAVWVDDRERGAGHRAAMAIMSARDGTVSGYAFDDQRLARAVPLLWRTRRAFDGINTRWLDPVAVLADIAAQRRTCALVVDGLARGAALFDEGVLVGAYSTSHRQPTTSTEVAIALLQSAGAQVALLGEVEEAPTARVADEPSYHVFIAREPQPPSSDSAADPGAHLPLEAPVEAPSSAELEPAPSDEPPPVALDEPIFSSPPLLSVVVPSGDGEPRADAELPVFVDVGGDELPTNQDFVGPRLDLDIEGLRRELVQIGVLWLGPEDVMPIAEILERTRPGVDEFVATIAAISSTEIPGHEASAVRAMAREMHYRAAEALCGA